MDEELLKHVQSPLEVGTLRHLDRVRRQSYSKLQMHSVDSAKGSAWFTISFFSKIKCADCVRNLDSILEEKNCISWYDG